MKFSLLFLTAIFLPVLASAKSDGLEVRLSSPLQVDTDPGKVVTASFVVTNHSEHSDDFVEELVIPEGWTRIAPVLVPFELPTGANAVRLVAFAVAPGAPAGRSEIRYSVRGRRHPGLADGSTFSVIVSSVSQVQVDLLEKPGLAIAGEEYTAKFRITNRGNARTTLATEIKSRPEFPVSGAPSTITLDPGESSDLTLRVKADDVSRRTHHSVVLKASAAPDEPPAASTSIVEVLPRISGDRDPYIRIPTTIRLMMGQETDRDPAVQLELAGGGALDEEGKRRIDFLFRGPDAADDTLLGERDEYRISYYGEKWDFHLGDRTYSLSPLTERYGYGRGAQVDWHDGPWGAGLFYMQSRWQKPDLKEVGAYTRHDFSQAFGIQANFLRKWSEDRRVPGTFPQNIYSLGARWQPGKYLDAGFEFGIADSDRGIDTGIHFSARGEIGRLNYAVEKTRAEPNFRGSYNDTESTHASLNYAFTDRFRAHASFRDYTSSLERNEERSTVVTQERAFLGGVRYSFPTRTDLSLQYQDVERADVLGKAAFDFHERSLRFGVGQSVGKVRVQSHIDAGLLDNRLEDVHDTPFQRYMVAANYSPTSSQSYGISASYGPNSLTGKLDDKLSLGVSASFRVRENIRFQASYARNTYDSRHGSTHDTAHARLTYVMPNKSSVSVLGRYSSNSRADRPEAAVWVTYSVPLSLPIGKKKSIGQIRGRVMQGKGYAARPLPRAIILANEFSAVSDNSGEFTFPALQPGHYTMRVEPSSIGIDCVTVRPFPVIVEVKKAQSATLDVQVVKAASLEVNVGLATATPKTKLGEEPTIEDRGGFEGGVIEITDGQDVIRMQTDRHGNATFGHLRPGSWQVKLDGSNLPPHHTIDNGSASFELAPGQTGRVNMKVVEQVRTIQIVDEGTIE